MNRRAFISALPPLVIAPGLAVAEGFDPDGEYGFYARWSVEQAIDDARKHVPARYMFEIRARRFNHGREEAIAWYYNRVLQRQPRFRGREAFGGYCLLYRGR